MSLKTLPGYLLSKVAQHTERSPEKVFMIDGVSDKKLMYSELEPLSRRLASALVTVGGVTKGDIVIHLTSYQIQHIPLVLATWRANAVIRCLYKEDDAGNLSIFNLYLFTLIDRLMQFTV